MKLGLHYWNFTTPAEVTAIGPSIGETARLAEQAGVHSFTVMDHYFQMEAMAPAEEPMLEGYTTLGFLAAQTERMKLGAPGHRRHVPPPRPTCQDRDHPGRAVPGPGPIRHRGLLVRA